MVLKNIFNVNLKCQSYFSLKEFSYFMLANQIYKSQTEEKDEQIRMSQVGINQNIRSNIFQNKKMQKNGRNEFNTSMPSYR